MNYTGIKIFGTIELVLYLSYLRLDIKGISDISSYIKFFSILICFLWAGICSIRYNRDKIIPIALGFSVLSDIFLLFTNYFVPGLVFFIMVQILFYFVLSRGGWIHRNAQIWIRIGLPILILVLFYVIGVAFDLVLILAVFYIVSFAATVLAAICAARKSPDNRAMRLFMLGLILFFLCDINVGIFNLSSYLQMDSKVLYSLRNFSAVGMWFFYLPGQILIGLSNLAAKVK